MRRILLAGRFEDTAVRIRWRTVEVPRVLAVVAARMVASLNQFSVAMSQRVALTLVYEQRVCKTSTSVYVKVC